MIEIIKPVSRRLRIARSYRGKSRAVVAILEPGDLLSFRLAGCRHKMSVPLEDIFWEAHRRVMHTQPPKKKKGSGNQKGRKKG